MNGNLSTDDKGIKQYEWIKLADDKLAADMTVSTVNLSKVVPPWQKIHVDLANNTTCKLKNSKHCDVSEVFSHYKSRCIFETDTKVESSFSTEIMM